MKQASLLDNGKPEKVDIGKEFKGEVIITKCMFRKEGRCHVVQNLPEPLICPCPQFVTFNGGAVDRFKEFAKKYKITGKLAGRIGSSVDYHDLLILAKGRGRQWEN
jgi:hypothetical protein